MKENRCDCCLTVCRTGETCWKKTVCRGETGNLLHFRSSLSMEQYHSNYCELMLMVVSVCSIVSERSTAMKSSLQAFDGINCASHASASPRNSTTSSSSCFTKFLYLAYLIKTYLTWRSLFSCSAVLLCKDRKGRAYNNTQTTTSRSLWLVHWQCCITTYLLASATHSWIPGNVCD